MAVGLSSTSAIFSDDGGLHWHASEGFPEGGTGESALIELSDGTIVHNSRKHYYADPESGYEWRRFVTTSHDGGRSWHGIHVAATIPDGPRYRGDEKRGHNYNGHFGLCAGLVRLPLAEADILVYSSCDEPGHERQRGSVWASFDGGKSWPRRRLVHEGPFAYSSLAAGRCGTASQGLIYLQYEGGENHRYQGGYIACFNLSWLLAGDDTGDGDVPIWLR